MSLEIPKEENEPIALLQWYKLFFLNDLYKESGFFNILRNESDIKLLKEQLEEWNDWQEDIRNNGEKKEKDDFSFTSSEWGYQYKRAEALINLHDIATRNPDILSKSDLFNNVNRETIDRVNFNWQYAAYLLLKHSEREIINQQKVNVLLESGDKEKGILCELTIQLYTAGDGVIFPNPKENALLNYGDTFLESIEQVWKYLIEKLSDRDKENSLAKIDASFQITTKFSGNWRTKSHFLWGINGPSATAAIYLCLYQAIMKYLGETTNFSLNNNFFAVTAAMDLPNNRNLCSVDGIERKLYKAVKGGMAEIVVATENKNDAQCALNANPDEQARNAKIIACSNIDDVIKYLAEQIREKKSVINKERRDCEKINWLDRNVSIGENFQMMPMLTTVRRDQLLSDQRKDLSRNENEERDERGKFSETTTRQWEELILQDSFVTIETSHSIADVFNNFQRILRTDQFRNNHIETIPRFVLLGSPGAGKSTFCRYLAWGCSEEALHDAEAIQWKLESKTGIQLVPARIRLLEWEREADTNSKYKNLHYYLESKFQSLPNYPTNEQWKDWLERGEVLLLLDGLDETNGSILEPLKEALDIFQNNCTIITCRTVSYETHQNIIPDFPIFTLAGLTESQQEKFIGAYLKISDEDKETNIISPIIDWLNENSNLQLLATNPLILTIFCFVIKSRIKEEKDFRNHLPSTRTQLYHQAIKLLLNSQKMNEGRNFSSKLPEVLQLSQEKYNILGSVAFDLWQETDERTLTFDDLEIINKLFERLRSGGYGESPRIYAGDLFTELNRVNRIFVGSNEKHSFLHLTIHEFLVASALAKNDNFIKIAIANLYDVNWSEVLAMLGGTLVIQDENERKLISNSEDEKYSPKAEAYIAALIEENSRDMFYRPFFAAVAAAVETGDKINPETKKYLFDKSMDLYFNPPDYLENEFFMPLIRLWNNDAVEYLRGKLRAYLDYKDNSSQDL